MSDVKDAAAEEAADDYAAAFAQMDAEEAGEAQESPLDTPAADDAGAEDGDQKAADAATDETIEADTDDDTSAEADADDIWANASDAQRAALEALTKERDTAKHEASSAKGRYAAAEKRLREVEKGPPKQEDKQDDDAKNDVWSNFQDEYPEIAEPVMDRIAALEQRLERVSTSAERADEVRYETNYQRVVADHSDYQDILDQHGSDLVDWVDDQPRKIRDTFQANSDEITDPEAVSDLISAFKKHLAGEGSYEPPANAGKTTDLRRQKQRQAAATPDGASKKGVVKSGLPKNGSYQEIFEMANEMEGL